MSLYGTHIRFALDLAGKYQATDLNKYLAGTVYPDSRYMTKIDRAHTHPKNIELDSFAGNDDFRKGWYAHLRCDEKLAEIVEDNYPEIFDNEFSYGNAGWIKFTALKILQDLQDIQKFDLKRYLKCFDYTENPNNEDITVIAQHHKIWKEMYLSHDLSIDHVMVYLVKLGMNAEIAEKIRLQAHEYTKDSKVMQFLGLIYEEMVKNTRKT